MALIFLTMTIREVTLWKVGAAHGRIGDMVLLVAAVLWFGSRCLNGSFAFVRNRLDQAVIGFLLLYVMSILWVGNFEAGGLRLFKLLRNGMLYILLVDYLGAEFRERYPRVVVWILLAGLFQTLAFMVSISMRGGLAALSILLHAEQVKSSDNILEVVRGDEGAGLFMKGVASFLPLCMFLGFGIVSFMRKLAARVSIWLLILTMVIMTVLSATRAAWVGLGVGFAVTWVLTAGEMTLKKIISGSILSVILLVGAMSFNLHTFIQSRFTPEVLDNDQAIQDRYEFFEFALGQFRESPMLGKGVGSIDPDEFFVVHNVYLQVLGELGVLGGVVFAVVMGLWVWMLLSTRKMARYWGDSFGMRNAAAALGGTMFFFTYFLAGHDLGGSEPWIIMGIASALYTHARRDVLVRQERSDTQANLRRGPVIMV